MSRLMIANIIDTAFRELKQHFLTWLAVIVISKLIPILCLMLLSQHLADSLITIRDGLNFYWTIGFVFIFSFFYMIYLKLRIEDLLVGKLYLTLVRQPELVKKYFWQALVYNFTDGFWKRFCYFILYFLHGGIILGGLMYILFHPIISSLIGKDGINYRYLASINFLLPFVLAFLLFLCLIIFNLLVAPTLFLLSFIIQDTCSKDNTQKALNYWQCVQTARYMMKGWKMKLIFLLGVQDFIPGIMIASALTLFVNLKFSTGPFPIGELLSLMIGTAILTIPTAIKAVWVNRMMEDDPDIVDFGG